MRSKYSIELDVEHNDAVCLFSEWLLKYSDKVSATEFVTNDRFHLELCGKDPYKLVYTAKYRNGKHKPFTEVFALDSKFLSSPVYVYNTIEAFLKMCFIKRVLPLSIEEIMKECQK